MSKNLTWIFLGITLILLGCIVFTGVINMVRWGFTMLSTQSFETNNYEFEEKIINITVKTDTADIVFQKSENSKISVTCFEQQNLKHSVNLKDNFLEITVKDTRKWYEYIDFNFKSPKITVQIPQEKYGELLIKSDTGKIEIPKDFTFENIDISGSTGDVINYASAKKNIKIKASTGKIKVENVSAENLELSVSTGNIITNNLSCTENLKISVSTGKTFLTNVNCNKLITKGDTGDITLEKVIANESFFIERSTGKVLLEKCDAQEIFITTDTGDIKGTLLSDKSFVTESDTGKVKVPQKTSGGKCEIKTDTGNIKIDVFS